MEQQLQDDQAKRESDYKLLPKALTAFGALLTVLFGIGYVLLANSQFVADDGPWKSMSGHQQVSAVVTGFAAVLSAAIALAILILILASITLGRWRRKIWTPLGTAWMRLLKWTILRSGAKALAEVRSRNIEGVNVHIALSAAQPKGTDAAFVLYDYSSVMKDIVITAPKDHVLVREARPVLFKGTADFCGEFQTKGIEQGIDFTISWTDRDGYPRFNFVHVPPPTTPRLPKGKPTGIPGNLSYGPLTTSRDIRDQSLTVQWKNGNVIGKLSPASGGAWSVSYGRMEGQVRGQFITVEELGRASTEQEGVEMLMARDVGEF